MKSKPALTAVGIRDEKKWKAMFFVSFSGISFLGVSTPFPLPGGFRKFKWVVEGRELCVRIPVG